MSQLKTQKIEIPAGVLYIVTQMAQAGHEAYVVGGAVRDTLLRSQPEPWYLSDTVQHVLFDFDFATDATPEQIQAIFPDAFYDNQFGTVAIAHKHLAELLPPVPEPATTEENESIIDLSEASKIHESLEQPNQESDAEPNWTPPNYEITTYRSKELYETDNRRPSSFNWGTSIHQDLQRRDFTINALALKIDAAVAEKKFSSATQWLVTLTPDEYQIIDEHDGYQDLQAGIVRAVGNPSTRYQEDALRLLRAVRFSVQLNFEIEDATYAAIKENAQLLPTISWDRIREEFLKILSSDYPAEGIELLDRTGLLQHILPELLKAKGVDQGGHHTTDVWTHSIEALRECPSKDPIVRLATLLHDIAKPPTYAVRQGNITFYNHEVIGARMAKKIGKRLKLPKKQIDRLFILVRYHMFYYQPENTDASIRRFMRKVGLENVDDILALREGDRLGSGARKTSWRLEEMKQRMIEQLHQPMDTSDLAINGHDLMNQVGIKPGPKLGQMLNTLLEHVLETPEDNTRDKLLEIAHSLKND